MAGTEEEVVSEVEADEIDGEESLSIEQELLRLSQARSILERNSNLVKPAERRSSCTNAPLHWLSLLR